MVEVGEERRVARDVGPGFELRLALLVPADEEVAGQRRLIAVEQREGGQDVAELGGREVVESGDDRIDFSAQSGAFTEVEGGFGELDFGCDGNEARCVAPQILELWSTDLRAEQWQCLHVEETDRRRDLLPDKEINGERIRQTKPSKMAIHRIRDDCRHLVASGVVSW